MLQVRKERKPDRILLHLSGTIEETVHLSTLFGPPEALMEIHCKDLTRINSVGVRAWVNYFEDCKRRGSTTRFFECSAAIVEQINLISNFLCGGEVISLYVPYFCRHCKSVSSHLYKVSDIRLLKTLPDVPCPKCELATAFDSPMEEFFVNIL